MDIAGEARRELALRELEKRHQAERDDLVAFIRYFFQREKGKEFVDNWHYHVIAEALKDVLSGNCPRLIINIPPGSGKTELITKCFPVWALGKRPDLQIIATGYSTTLTQTYGSEARDYYRSETFRTVFPRRPDIREDTNTKGFWKNEKGGSYYATGTGGSITGNRANVFLIDDPCKPDEAASDVIRTGVNNWYDNTVLSRLFDPLKDSVIIIMQRTHEDDLCGYLMAKETAGTGEKWRRIILPAIATEDEKHRKAGEALQKTKYPLEALSALKLSAGPANFSAQYQQDPVDKASREFHDEWFRYFDDLPREATRVFTAVDPAFSQKDSADDSAIITGAFDKDKLYILEVTAGHFDPYQLENEIIRHAKVWRPEKIGIESVQAQQALAFSLKHRVVKESLLTTVHEIQARTDKELRIRRLIPLYARGLIHHKRHAMWLEKLESQLLKFPRAKHDDVIDALQYLYELYTLQPNTGLRYNLPTVKYDTMGRAIFD